MSYVTIGKPIPRVEGVSKVTGQELYAADVTLPETLWAKVLRSTVPHGRLVRVDASRARALRGVQAVLTGADIPSLLIGQRLKDMPVLAVDRVRYVGEPVAAVAAESQEVADEALELIEVEYQELPAVLDPVAAMADGAPLLHDDPSRYKNAPSLPPGIPNLQGFALLENGDIEKAFREAERIFEHTFYTQLTHHGYLEPHACSVRIDSEGVVEIWASNKWPFLLREMLAEDLGIARDRVRVHVMSVGGDFGGKASLIDVPICSVLAQRTGRPIKMTLTYTEELVAAGHRHPTVISLRTAVTADGTLRGMEAKTIFSGGAYGGLKFSPQVVVMGARQAGSPYRIPAIRIENYCVYTNHVPCTQTRAPGAPQIIFAVESHMDLIARELGIDPVEFRLRNLVEEGDPSPLGQKWQHVRARETLRKAVESSTWGQPKPSPSYGRGVAFYERAAAAGKSGAAITVGEDGRVRVDIGVPDVGPGTATIVQQIVAETLGLPLDRVSVSAGDTDSAPYDAGVGGSKSTNSVGHAAHRAALEARGRLRDLAAQQLECLPEKIEASDGRFVSPDGNSISLGELARLSSPEEGLSAVAVFEPESQAPVTSFCAQVAEVDVDPETGQVQVKRLVTAHDVGTIINVAMHQGQIEGGVVQGLGFGLMEETPMEEGRIVTPHMGDFKIPGTKDIPPLITVLLESPTGPVPFQGKAIGEIPNVPTAAAIANAVHDAVGLRSYELPITSERVVRALASVEKR